MSNICLTFVALSFLTFSVYTSSFEGAQTQHLSNIITTNSSCMEDCCSKLVTRKPLTYYFYQKTGKFRGGQGEWSINTMTYSGQGKGYNNPDQQCNVNGPLPATTYEVAFCKNIMHQTTNKPCSFYLKPLKALEACGRDDFFIHGCQCCTAGDDTQPPAAGCSAGCIIMNYENRRRIRIGDRIIVMSYEPNMEQEQKEQILIQQ